MKANGTHCNDKRQRVKKKITTTTATDVSRALCTKQHRVKQSRVGPEIEQLLCSHRTFTVEMYECNRRSSSSSNVKQASKEEIQKAASKERATARSQFTIFIRLLLFVCPFRFAVIPYRSGLYYCTEFMARTISHV